MKLTELERRRAYRRAFELLDKIDYLLEKALIAHNKAHADKMREKAKKAA